MTISAKGKRNAIELDREAEDSPALDFSDDSFKKMIRSSKQRGYVTMDELNSVLTSDDVNSETVEDMMPMLSSMGINIVDGDDLDDLDDLDDCSEDSLEKTQESTTKLIQKRKDIVDHSYHDPVRMYLSEMGSIQLLSREGEIALAKRIEAGRSMMMAGLCESPLTFQALIIWRDELNEGTTLLREIIDLDEAFVSVPRSKESGFHSSEDDPNPANEEKDRNRDDIDSKKNADNGDNKEDEMLDEDDEDEDEEDDDSSHTLSARENQIRSQVMNTLDEIANSYQRLRILQDNNNKRDDNVALECRELKEKLVKLVRSLSLKRNRISLLIEQLYGISKRIIHNEGKLLRLAESHGVNRDVFLNRYKEKGIDYNWLDYAKDFPEDGWKNFIACEKDSILGIVNELKEISSETGVSISEFRHIVSMVRKGESEASVAKKEMVEANLRLVIAVAKRYTNRGLQLLDLIQEGNIGLMKAVEKFNCGLGFKLITYSMFWVKQSITRFISDHSRMIRVPVHMNERINKIVRTSRQMANKIGREPTADELAEKLNMPLDQVRKVLKIAKDPISLETPIGDEDSSYLGDFIEDKNVVSPVDSAIQSNLRETTTRVLASLTPREERVLRMRFGIGMNTDHTLEEVGKQFCVTRERIRQIEAKAIRKLKHPSRSKKLRSFLDC
ncbi:MAG: RNA polymerase sigma factor RpoD [Candidatus Liberibacter europaeus]|uniref:RNA polymerase sigma factor RpoD n=1 Tax=Candidatus Liberibacter europaeus TaxID=744859 RepID=A0A2T4VY97_9HYPH|nr:RNA polymerase sigma factor RpoD [Candidatus Liberibacter europaeus]PTL86752.1 MAG: RNA polymerase sigma factor RpoD [Candidatus Liberibacter europaeus]